MIFLSKMLTRDQAVMLEETTKEAALERMVRVLATSAKIHNEKELLDAIRGRELIMSTGIGFGIAVPHAKIRSVTNFIVAVGVAQGGIEFNSLDGKPVKIIVMIAGPEFQHEQYLRILARTTLLLKDPKNREAILSAKTEDDVYRLFTEGND
jgi:mannitol/fructose-specific phosphotransferase system IIA component (Ntr-type)